MNHHEFSTNDSTRKVIPSTKSRQTIISEFNAVLNSGLYDKALLYLSEGESGSMLYQIGHNCHIEEIMEFRHTFASFTSPFSKENVSHQNALRLTITETNMTYNFANCERWSSEPYVLGIRIRLSGNHPEEDICDELAGDYPKDFMFRG